MRGLISWWDARGEFNVGGAVETGGLEEGGMEAMSTAQRTEEAEEVRRKKHGVCSTWESFITSLIVSLAVQDKF